ncbi:hypothetical protein [Streptomyces sp. NPDC059071]|uniref:hypothetical protein n=1 Tax=unclassified Streptomyces TaxID=2593676 RepID=UPI00364DA1CA
MTEPHLTLFSSSLLSKWGFNDGDEPSDWLDYCEGKGIDYTALPFPLIPLVRIHLLPRIDQDVSLVEVETIHNPIRVETVEGVDVTEVWFGRAPEPTLTPDHVNVPMTEVLRLALAEAGLTEPPRFDPPLPLT